MAWLLLVFGSIAFTTVLFYLYHYYYNVVSKPKVVYADSDRLEYLKEHCPALFESFRPTPWAINGYAQSFVRVAIQSYPKTQRRREALRLKDGGHVCLDWYNERNSEQPTVLILPGVTGSSDENYVCHWVKDMTELGYRSVVFNYRGCGKSKLSTPKVYSGADTSDLTEVVHHVHSTLPHSPLLAVGVSLGSTYLIKYVTDCKREGVDSHLKAVMLFSVTWNVFETDRICSQTFNRHLFNRYFTSNIRGMLKENRDIFHEYSKREKLCFDYEKALKCTSIAELYDVLFIPMFGYESVEQMLNVASPHLRASDINIPTLALNSADDPLSPEWTIPEAEALSNPNLVLVTLNRGGHIGFIEGLLPIGQTLMDRVLIQFARTVFNSDG